MSSRPEVKRICIFLPSFGTGGVERMLINLASGFAAMGHPPDFVVRKAGSPYLQRLPETVKLVELDDLHRNVGVAAALYLGRAAPYAMLTSKEENDRIAIKAKEKSGSDTRIVVRVPVNVTSRLKYKGRGPLKRWETHLGLKRTMNRADALVAVSNGVASDISSITGIPSEKIHVIRNPVVTPELEKLAQAPLHHKWFMPKDEPVLLGIGRLGSQKNFELLIRAFAKVRLKTECRLIILGEGRRHGRIVRLTEKLGLKRYVDLPGFATNPYAYLSRSDLFVLSSNWEGSPNALTEALALGVPVVSTDCESGPREILQEGRYGKLVPLNDPQAMADAILETLLNPVEDGILKEAAKDYSIERSAIEYLGVMMGG